MGETVRKTLSRLVVVLVVIGISATNFGCGSSQSGNSQATPKAETEDPQADQTASPASKESVSKNVPPESAMLGVNLASAEFGKLPGVYGKDYAYPGAKQFDYFKSKGLTVIRIPFRWERMQPELMKPLDAKELAHLDEVMKLARERNMKILLDLHNYARYRGNLVGTPEVPNAALANFWTQMATHYKDEPALFAYGIMNEPHGTKGLWPAAAQAAVDAIRSVDPKNTITVCGDGWAGAHSWPKLNENLLLTDPSNNLLYEAHQYFDRDNSGTYKQPFDDSGATAETGVRRLQPFFDWLEQHNARGFIGEFGVPDDDPRWLVVLDNALAAMKKHQVGGTYWAAGGWWGKYPLSVEPHDGKDRPQMEVLALYAGDKTRPTDAKMPYDDAFAAAAATPKPKKEIEAHPPGTAKVIYDFGKKKESYAYKNDASSLATKLVEDQGKPSLAVDFDPKGEPAWAGIGLYFGDLKVEGFSAFRLLARADKPCKVSLQVTASDDKQYSAGFSLTPEWQEVRIPIGSLRKGDVEFDPARRVIKVNLQPSVVRGGNTLYFAKLELTAD